MNIPFHPQEAPHTCGPAAMRMALAALRIKRSEKALVNLLHTKKRSGTRHGAFPVVAERLKLQYIVCRHAATADIQKLLKDGYIILTCFAPDYGHYIVVTAVTNKTILFHDPIEGPNQSGSIAEFIPLWHGTYNDREPGWFFGIKR